jgi:hypothetical protein
MTTQTPAPSPKPQPKTNVIGKSATSLVAIKKRAEIQIRVRKPVTIFYVGGAGDKRKFVPGPKALMGPFANIIDAKNHVERRISDLRDLKLIEDHWLGYYEIYGAENIKKNVLAFIPLKTTPVFIIGHSLGGWNGAHLSRTLGNAGYNVEMLVTIDPVGEGVAVATGSDIYPKRPEVSAKKWINIRANPKNENGSDFIAEFGERWTVKVGPDINCELDVNHADAGIMFNRKISGQKTAADLVADAIRECTK